MKNICHSIELHQSVTQNLRQSPQEELRCISSNVSFEGSPHKGLLSPNYRLVLKKKESFTINGWENPRDRLVKSLQRTSKAKSPLIKNSIFSNISKLLNPEPKRNNFHTMELKTNRNREGFNFKYGLRQRHTSSSLRNSENANFKVQCAQSSKFNEHLNKEKMVMINFYNNQRIKRRLMNDLMESHQSVTIVEYPIQMDSARECPTGQRKRSIYRRFCH